MSTRSGLWALVAAVVVSSATAGCTTVGNAANEAGAAQQTSAPTAATDPGPSAGTQTGANTSTTTPSPQGPTTSAVSGTTAPPPRPTTTIPHTGDADAPPVTTSTVQRFEGGDKPTWDSAGWSAEAAGEGKAVVTKGVGRMVVDPRGTYEWVRAIGATGPFDNFGVEAAITPRTEALGSVYIGLRGNGNWNFAAPYLPATGIAIEYAYAPGIESELRLYKVTDAGITDGGAVPVPALAKGTKGHLRVEVSGTTVRAKTWHEGEKEPTGWAIERTLDGPPAGSLHLSYRDEPGGTVDWDDLIVKPLR